MKLPNTTVFITYNPGNGFEQTLASRLHTIGAVNGFRMYLPDRFNSDVILDHETQRRINLSDYFILFSFSPLSEMVRQEIEKAYNHLRDPSRIIVVYNRGEGENLTGDITKHFTKFNFDPFKDDSSDFVQKIIASINKKERQLVNQQLQNEKQKNENNRAIMALLGIGLGLFALASFSKSE